MINKDRIVAVTATDLITLYSQILAIAGTSYTVAHADNSEGDFKLTSGSGNILADEPVKSFDFATAVTSATVYFVPAYDYTGFSINGEAVTTSGATIEADHGNLYTATLSGGTVTIAKVGQ